MRQTHYTVLVVEDSAEDRELYRRLLSQDKTCSYTILEAETGQEGLALWQQHHPDILLLDYRLPDFDGLEVLAQLQEKSQQPALPVVMVTGLGNEAVLVQALKAGAQDYLVKGQITAERLHLAIQGAIATVALQAQLQQRIELERVITQITRQIHSSLNLDEILQTTVREVRSFLHTDRVVIFQIQPDGWGTVTTEAVGAEWIPLLSTSHYDPCFNEHYAEPFRQGLVTVKPDIYDGSIDPCHVELLANLQVRANLVVPILQDDQLWGMLIAHHCAAPRQWEDLEINLLKELATQVGIALQQAELYQQSQCEIAERKRIEVALRESEERLQLGIQVAGVGLAKVDYHSNTVLLSPKAAELYGIATDQLQINREELHQTIHPEERPLLEQHILELLDPNSSGWFEIDHRVLWKAGQVRWLSVRKQVFFDRSSDIPRPDYAILAAIDITERKQAEQEREQLLAQAEAARAEAEAANQSKDEFVAIVAHELRSPLNSIAGWAKLMQSRKVDEATQAKALETIWRNTQIQVQLVEDLLDLSRMVRGTLQITLAPVDWVTVMESALEIVRPSAEAKSIQLETRIAFASQVSGDFNRLQQIALNLLTNAIKFTSEGGRVEVQLLQVGTQVKLRVQDTGKGIAPEFLPQIFERFQQGQRNTGAKDGLGLGLAIAKNLVELHNGTIQAESAGVGQGATFTVSLPRLELPAVKEFSLMSTATSLAAVRILAVDDEPDMLALITYVLRDVGAEVKAVTSATEALTWLNQFKPDILLSDIAMPGGNGYELLQQVRAEPAGQIPAIALTSYASATYSERSLQAGFQRHLAKPIEPDVLVATIMSLVGDKD